MRIYITPVVQLFVLTACFWVPESNVDGVKLNVMSNKKKSIQDMLSVTHAQLHDDLKKKLGEKIHNFQESMGQKDTSLIKQKSYSEEYVHKYPHHHNDIHYDNVNHHDYYHHHHYHPQKYYQDIHYDYIDHHYPYHYPHHYSHHHHHHHHHQPHDHHRGIHNDVVQGNVDDTVDDVDYPVDHPDVEEVVNEDNHDAANDYDRDNHPTEWEAEKEYLAETLADKINSNVLVYLEGGMKNKNKKGKSVDIPDVEEVKDYAIGVANIMGENSIENLNKELLNALKGKLTPKEYEQLNSTLEENVPDLVAPDLKKTLKGSDLEDDEIEEAIDEVADILVDDITGGPLNPMEQLSKEVNVHDVSVYTPETY